MQFLSYLINGISLGSVYALIALGYTMVYGIAKMLNFAHGDVIMIGSYVIFFAFGSFGLNPIVSVLLSMVVCTILGITMERVAYRPLREAPSLAVLITAIGVSYLLQQVAQLLWTSNPKNFKSVVSLQPIKLFDGLHPHHGCAHPVHQPHFRRSRYAGCVRGPRCCPADGH